MEDMKTKFTVENTGETAVDDPDFGHLEPGEIKGFDRGLTTDDLPGLLARKHPLRIEYTRVD